MNPARNANLTNAGKGRPKGVPNKATAQLKEAILQALEASGDENGKGGSIGYLTWLSKDNSAAFAGLVGKVLPHTIAGDPDAPLRVEQVIEDASAVERRLVQGLASVGTGKPPQPTQH